MPSPPNPPTIALLSDFGLTDWFVGTIKGVILSIAPNAVLIDICHEVSKHCVEDAAFILNASHRFFPNGTIFLCIVDPEVGSMREPLVARNENYFFVAPNNGLLTFVAVQSEEWDIRKIENQAYISEKPSQTFHGRDVFAPAAAHLAQGAPFESFGETIENYIKLPFIENVRVDKNRITGRIIYIDHYGNLLSNITRDMLPDNIDVARFRLHYKDRSIYGFSPHYAAVPVNHPLMYWGSAGVLEIAVNRGSAARRWSAQTGEWFELEWP